MLKAIVFDYNGVLVDDLKAHEEAYLYAARVFNRPLSLKTVEQYVSYAIDKKREYYFGSISDQEWDEILKTKTNRYFQITAQNNPVFPDVETVLEALSLKYTLALMSNTTRENFNGVFPNALAGYFKETLFADEMENPKPSPEPLYKIMGHLGVSKDACCYVGDSLLDIEMCRKAGVMIFGVATGHVPFEELKDAGADHVASSLTEVKEYLIG